MITKLYKRLEGIYSSPSMDYVFKDEEHKNRMRDAMWFLWSVGGIIIDNTLYLKDEIHKIIIKDMMYEHFEHVVDNCESTNTVTLATELLKTYFGWDDYIDELYKRHNPPQTLYEKGGAA